VVGTGGGGPAAVGEYLPGFGVIQGKAGEGLAGEDAGYPPRVKPGLEPRIVGGPYHIPHRIPVVGEIRFGKTVDDVGAAVVHHVLQVSADVTDGSGREVRDACLHGWPQYNGWLELEAKRLLSYDGT